MAAAVHDAPAPPNVFDKFRKPRSRAEPLASGNACTLIVCMNDAFAPTATPDKAENTTNPVAFGNMNNTTAPAAIRAIINADSDLTLPGASEIGPATGQQTNPVPSMIAAFNDIICRVAFWSSSR